jgi:hypothetical protein
MVSLPPALNQRGEADPALATLKSRLGTAGLGGTLGTIGNQDLLQTMVAGRLATAAGLHQGTSIKGQGAGPAIPQLLPAHPTTHPALHPALLLALLPLLLLLNRHNRATLQKGWSWMLFTTGALVDPLRTRRHVIHDRPYLDKMLEAEFGADSDAGPEGSRRPRQASSGSDREATSGGQGDGNDPERTRRRSSDPDSSHDSSRSRQP